MPDNASDLPPDHNNPTPEPGPSNHTSLQSDATSRPTHTSPRQPFHASIQPGYINEVGGTRYPTSGSRSASIGPGDEPETIPSPLSVAMWDDSALAAGRRNTTPVGSPPYRAADYESDSSSDQRHTPPIPEIRLIDPTPITTIGSSTSTPSTFTIIPWRDTLEIPTEEVSRNAKRRRITEVEVDLPAAGTESNLLVERTEPKRWAWVVRELHDMCLQGVPGTSEGVFRVENNGSCTILHPIRGEIGLGREMTLDLLDLVESLDQEAIAHEAKTSNHPTTISPGRPLLYEPTISKDETMPQNLTDEEKCRQVGIAKYVVRASPLADNRAEISRRVIERLWTHGSTLEPALVRLAKFLVHQALQNPERVAALCPPQDHVLDTTPTMVTEAEPTSTTAPSFPNTIPTASSAERINSTLMTENSDAVTAPTTSPGPEPRTTISTEDSLVEEQVASRNRFHLLGDFLLILRDLAGSSSTIQQLLDRGAEGLIARGVTETQALEASADAEPYVAGLVELPAEFRLLFASSDLARTPLSGIREQIHLRRVLHERWVSFSAALSPQELERRMLDALLINGADHILATRLLREHRSDLRDLARIRRRYGSMPVVARRHVGYIGRLEDDETESKSLSLRSSGPGTASGSASGDFATPSVPSNSELQSVPLSLDRSTSTTAGRSSGSNIATPAARSNADQQSILLPQHPNTSSTVMGSSDTEAPNPRSARSSPHRKGTKSVQRKLPSAPNDESLAPTPSRESTPTKRQPKTATLPLRASYTSSSIPTATAPRRPLPTVDEHITPENSNYPPNLVPILRRPTTAPIASSSYTNMALIPNELLNPPTSLHVYVPPGTSSVFPPTPLPPLHHVYVPAGTSTIFSQGLVQPVRRSTSISAPAPRSISNPIPTAVAIIPAKRPRRLSDVGEPLSSAGTHNTAFESVAQGPSSQAIQPRSIDDQNVVNSIQLSQYKFPPGGAHSRNP